ncbi:hypothetical protein DS843_17660 [Roseomonas genomospecies 6]|uniref:Uncharacterized protein n=1 Tax=Roseomonas genomospecies 6 TaxID=214106 RepID=A0A9W7TV10_9PROT|nr:hypothetical protein DS843_17660 [Roseomonas genomospecies 6]
MSLRSIPLPPRERVPAQRAGEGRARIEVLIVGGTLTLPPLRGGSLPLPGRERGVLHHGKCSGARP